jgi:hypothetical protein
MNAKGGGRRAILPGGGVEGGGTPADQGAEAAAQESDAEDEPGLVAPEGAESGWPSDDEALEDVRPVVLGAAWRLPVVLLAMDGTEEAGLDLQFDPETGEPLAEE